MRCGVLQRLLYSMGVHGGKNAMLCRKPEETAKYLSRTITTDKMSLCLFNRDFALIALYIYRFGVLLL